MSSKENVHLFIVFLNLNFLTSNTFSAQKHFACVVNVLHFVPQDKDEEEKNKTDTASDGVTKAKKKKKKKKNAEENGAVGQVAGQLSNFFYLFYLYLLLSWNHVAAEG